MDVRTYESKPVQIKAVLLTESSIADVAKWCNGRIVDGKLQIPTLEGVTTAQPGKHFVIEGTAGENYPCAVDIFNNKYKEARPRFAYQGNGGIQVNNFS